MNNTTTDASEELLVLQVEAGSNNFEVEMKREQAEGLYHELRELLLY